MIRSQILPNSLVFAGDPCGFAPLKVESTECSQSNVDIKFGNGKTIELKETTSRNHSQDWSICDSETHNTRLNNSMIEAPI
jgi:hypothetical protein